MRFLGDDWFSRPLNQALLVAYANTRGGRRQLCISDDVPRGRSIIGVHRNRIEWLASQRVPGMVGALTQVAAARASGRPMRRVMDVRSRNKFAARLADLLSRDNLSSSLLHSLWRWERYGVRVPGISPRFAVAGTDTSYPDPDPEITTMDAWAARHNVSESWSSLVSGAGTQSQDTGSQQGCLQIFPAATADEWRQIRRGIFLFDTSAMAGGTVESAVLSLWTDHVDSIPIAPDLNIYGATPASNTAVAHADFGNCGTTEYSTTEPQADIASAAYEPWELVSAGEAAIDVGGISKFSMRNAGYDVAGVAPTWANDNPGFQYSDYIITMAEHSGTSRDPKLVTEWSAGGPPAGLALLLLGAE